MTISKVSEVVRQQVYKEDHEKRQQYRQNTIDQHQHEWEATGLKYRKKRLAYGMTIATMSKLSGFSSSKLSGFEHGHPLLNREVIECSYQMAFRLKLHEIEVAHNEFATA